MTTDVNTEIDRTQRMDTKAMNWSPSPSGTVWRKRVHHSGPEEAGQVTSVVRYAPQATFPAHDHPDGEEIFVLEGVFSDEHGDWPTGSYLLHPEGFRHAPFSTPGCLLLVKLRQYPGRDRRQVRCRVDQLPWVPSALPGIEHKCLYRQPGFRDETWLERWAPGTAIHGRHFPDGAECFVLEGALVDEEGRLEEGAWLRLPMDSRYHAHSPKGCTLYLKTGGLHYLQH
ncbi:cupin domain-containing protein [Algiphilus sp. NNCM1]|uniref:cupin domain-containing protein n=1 Tax=Algiphilus sp. TaxID=1872431 RepID=UPI001CA68CDF|nr:cupin domain-containing protein [Algiphilus sp.]MBY8965258.1 cupin domain-containing protein [Algiphilus acroporae]MCI5062700.1 cupin domain-containing protein [Algiphilus sp.]MCI5102970.1 cupin domain-containing protein [Algiphilus sp.]